MAEAKKRQKVLRAWHQMPSDVAIVRQHGFMVVEPSYGWSPKQDQKRKLTYWFGACVYTAKVPMNQSWLEAGHVKTDQNYGGKGPPKQNQSLIALGIAGGFFMPIFLAVIPFTL